MSEPFQRSDQATPASAFPAFESPQSAGGFRGSGDSPDGQGSIDHFALVYEDQAEQFESVVPFVREGLERNERCVYVVDEDARGDVVTALRDGGVDVDAALHAGQLSFHSVAETYLADGAFDVDRSRDLLRGAMADARDEYDGFRVTADGTWLGDDETVQTAFMALEAHVNDLLEDGSGMALCQYDRTALPPALVEDVIETHPYLIYDGTVCQNAFYTPPEEYFGSDDPARQNERKLRALVERTDARTSFEARERYQREMYELTSDPDRSFEEKLDALFDLGCEWFDLDVGGLAEVEPESDLFEVEQVSGDHDYLVPGARADLSETYCRVATDACPGEKAADPVAVTDPVADGFEGKLCYEEFGVRAYFGTHLELDDAPDRTLWFVSTSMRERPFSEAERTFLHQMGQWVQYELERRNRERELRERTEHLSALVETTPECIKTVAADGTLLQMNPAGLEMIEAESASDVTGENVYDLIAPEHRERFREFNERICRGERGTLAFDVIGLGGTRRHMETHAAPLSRPDGTTVQVALTHDVTEREQRERQLQELIDRLEESNERLEQFAYAASHDLQEPLRMVSSYLQLIERRYADALDADGEEYLAFAVDGADRMREMIEGLLAYSRIETQGEPLVPVDLDDAFDDVLSDLQVQIDESDAEITAEGLPRVEGDATQLRQVFQNLLENAIDYSGDEAPRIHVSTERDGSEWIVSVRDEGIGIDAAEQDRIFEVFQRLHAHGESNGAGIGLALCERVVERHGVQPTSERPGSTDEQSESVGGDIWVESEPGEWTEFSFTLPAVRDDSH